MVTSTTRIAPDSPAHDDPTPAAPPPVVVWATAPAAVPVPRPVSVDLEQVKAESALVRSTTIGAAIGVVLCAGIWTGLVALATVGSGTALLPALGMAAGCGIFAGLFLGGCAGALAGSRRLERVEHERMHLAREAAPGAPAR